MRGITIIFWAAASSAAGAQDVPTCANCHDKQFQEIRASVHAGAAVCADCHGGDPKAATKEGAHAAGFKGRPDRRSVPSLCAGCHSDVRRMNPYGLPTDQYDQYLTSKHGETLAKGNTDVAVCVDCHGVHGIRRVKDPASPVYPTNVPRTCERCHSDADLMAKYGLKPYAQRLYETSVHGEALLVKGDLSAPQCATCHGSHGAVPPGFSDVGHVCGKCHPRQLEFFQSSPHARFVKSGMFEGCVACHENHMIRRTFETIFPRCGDCHEKDSEAMKRRDAIRALIEKSQDGYRTAGNRVASLARAGFFTDDEQALLQDANTAILQMPVVQHALDTAKVAKLEEAAGATIREIGERLDRKEKSERVKKLATIPIWLFLLLLAWALWARRRQIARERGQGGAHIG